MSVREDAREERYSPWVKICGITCLEDAQVCLDAGADALGINLVPQSKRFVQLPVAIEIARLARGRAEVVVVVADQDLQHLLSIDSALQPDWFQLHGSEPPELVMQLAPRAYKAVRIGSARDVTRALDYAGPRVLVDAAATGQLGGTGMRFDWSLVSGLVAQRRVILAGGLDPGNVAEAVTQLGPWGVDVASGVEGRQPRRKDPSAVREFVRAARDAATRTPQGGSPA